MDRLGIIVPYRDRLEHLNIFKNHIKEYFNNSGIEFELIIVEQLDTKPFNRGKLLNVGFIEAKKLGCNYIVFHDVDMLPIDVEYTYSDKVIHLATDLVLNDGTIKDSFDSYFGGVTMFPIELFEKVNGYPNEYWGWGFEDDELLRRCIEDGIEINSEYKRNKLINSEALKFNGIDSYIRVKNNIDFILPITISVTFKVDMILDESKEYDEWTIFSIPGWDLTLTYNSFGRYKFEFWDYKKEVYSINSSISQNNLTTIQIEINPNDCIVKMLKDNQYVGASTYNRKLLNYSKQEWIYIGNANPYRGDNFKELYGYVVDFKIWNDDTKIVDLDFKNYISYNIYNKPTNENYDVFNCTKVDINENRYDLLPTPIRRRSTFKLLNHTNNGFENGKWKSDDTRKNQIKYFNKTDKSGLKDIKYTLISSADSHLKVKL